MLIDDLKKLQEDNVRGSDGIVNKYKVEMIYYLVIESIIQKYGTASANSMSLIHHDALGCARDQIAMRLSDSGIVKYNKDGEIKGLTKDNLQKIVQESFLNSEALRKTISANLASNEYRTLDASKDDLDNVLYDIVDERLRYEADINNTDSLAYKVWNMVEHFDDSMESSEQSKYAMYMGNVSFDAANINKSIPDSNKKHVMLKISPLLPELRNLRRIGVPFLGLDSSKDNKAANMILQYDAQKGALSVAKDYVDYIKVQRAGVGLGEYVDSLVVKPTEYAKADVKMSKVVQQDVSTDVEPVYESRVVEKTTSILASNKTLRDIDTIMRWRMLEVLDKYSSQNLTDADVRAVQDIFDNSYQGSGCLFGDINRIGVDGIEKNANAYFDYLDHVCATAKDKIPSHEFEVHLQRAAYNEHDSNDRVYMLYFTGEQTSNFNTAKKNASRFLNTFIYANYIPKNMRVSPMIGDIGSASFNSYIITNKELRGENPGSDADMLDATRNRYFHSRRITEDMVHNMRKAFDEYTSSSNRPANENIVIRKTTKNVGETEIDDLSEFITVVGNRGVVDTAKILKMLAEERDFTKREQLEQFINNNNGRSFNNVLIEYMSQNGNAQTVSEALHHMLLKNQNIHTIADLRREFTNQLTNNLAHELRNQYGIAQNSFVISNHIFIKYIQAYTNECMTELCNHLEQNGVILNTGIDMVNIAEYKPFVLTADLSKVADKTIDGMHDEKSKILSDGLDELFGTGNIIKANTCKYASRKFPADVYEDMLKLLSYDEKVVYETNKVKTIAELTDDIKRDNLSCIIQLYSNKTLEISDNDAINEISDVEENVEDEDSAGEDVSFDSESWYISTFANIDNDDDLSLRDIESQYGENRQEMAVFRATHPLQTAAMRRVAQHMRSFAGNYDMNNLKITKQGIIYYQNIDDAGNKTTMFKIGPVIDECAYIHPIVVEDENGELIDRPLRDANGNIEYDAQGKALTEKVRVRVVPEIQLDGAGNLINEVSFGALDTPSFIGKENSVPNRFYGISSKIYNYDGYNHTGNHFIDRLQFSTYQSSVLNAIDDNMALHKIVSFGVNDAINAKIGLSVLYTNTGANSLLKCYRTNTYILEDKEKSAMAHHYMSNLLGTDDEKFAILADEDKDNPVAQEALKKVANMMMMQSKMYHDRVVMPKIKIDQNIGLYNMVLNISQCSYKEIRGEIDRKNMRLTDSKSARAVVFDPNPMFDNTLTGTAKQLGAVAFFTDAVDFDPITCKHVVLNDDEHARCSIISTGILDVENGGIDCRMNNYPGGQAVDRQQLSNNAAEKSLNYATNMKFAMISLGHNMEDGYCVASRAASKIGHFGKDGKFHVDNNWDKIGDTESGNKGVTAKIIDTSIAEDILDDNEADIEFRTVFTQRYLSNYLFNYGKNSDDKLNAEMAKALNKIVDEYPATILGNTFAEKVSTLINKYVEDVKDTYSNSSQDEIDEALKKAYEQRDVELKEFYKFVGEKLEDKQIEPFYGAFKLEQFQWRLFRDNPDLDLAVTNVCVLTRSNPSLLMYITDELRNDELEGTNNSTLIVRDINGEKIEQKGACGRYNIYVDSHTAEDKNRDYTESFSRSGRKYGAQELYALTAKFCDDDFIKLVTTNDPTLSERVLTKLNHKLMMNGFVFDPKDNLKAKTIEMLLKGEDGDGIVLTQKSQDDPANLVSEHVAGASFVDIDYFADELLNKVFEKDVVESDFKAAISDLSEGKFGKLFGIIDRNLSESRVDKKNTMAEDRLHGFFTMQFGLFGGNFAILPESLNSAYVGVYHDIKDDYSNNSADVVAEAVSAEYDYEYDSEIRWSTKNEPDGKAINLSGIVNIDKGDGEIEAKKAVPLFLSSREFAINDGDMQGAVIDDKLQFDMYKTMLAGAVLDRARKKIGKYIDDDMYKDVSEALSRRLERDYQKVTNTKSLDISDMGKWLKKNVYNIVFPKSLTAVWSGDPTLEIDEVGLSFEKAKNLGLLKVKDKNAPDDYEHMLDRYKALGDNDLVLINRSPGQTTGCIRALRFRITGPDGDGIRVHPAIATVFDGDFDGDTIGVINYKAINGPNVTHEMITNATNELVRTMTMQANLIQTAAYSKIEAKNVSALSKIKPELQDNGSIKYVNPLFIAGNSDIAIAKYNMKATNYVSSIGKNIDDTLDTITISANIIEQLKQINKDLDNVSKGYITKDDFSNIKGDDLLSRRLDQIDALKSYFADGDKDGVYISKQIADIISVIEVKQQLVLSNDVHDDVYTEKLKIVTESIQNLVSDAEKHNKEQLSSVYRDMTAYIAEKPLYTHGESDFEILENIINDANISKKGKIPQLNALLMFSGVHARCNEIHDGVKNTGLIVVQDELTKKYEIRMQQPDVPQGVKIEPGSELRAQVIANTKLDYKRAVSDVPKNEYKTQIESNIVAQSDKSDGTGFGGSTAQKMQKIFGSMGYAELGLRISGPITQMFLDAKQNVIVCEKNLMVGKFLLEKICRFEYVHELSNAEYNKSRPEQVRNGQFTFEDPNHKGKRYLTVQEGIEQLDNFMDMMGLDRFSPIDKQIMKTCLSKFADSKGYLKNVIEKCDKQNDRTYAAMYTGGNYASYMYHSVAEGQTLYSGSIYSGNIDTNHMIETIESKNNKYNISSNMKVEDKVDDVQDKVVSKAKTQNYEVPVGKSISGGSKAINKMLKIPVISKPVAPDILKTEDEISKLQDSMSDLATRTAIAAEKSDTKNTQIDIIARRDEMDAKDEVVTDDKSKTLGE